MAAGLDDWGPVCVVRHCNAAPPHMLLLHTAPILVSCRATCCRPAVCAGICARGPHADAAPACCSGPGCSSIGSGFMSELGAHPTPPKMLRSRTAPRLQQHQLAGSSQCLIHAPATYSTPQGSALQGRSTRTQISSSATRGRGTRLQMYAPHEASAHILVPADTQQHHICREPGWLHSALCPRSAQWGLCWLLGSISPSPLNPVPPVQVVFLDSPAGVGWSYSDNPYDMTTGEQPGHCLLGAAACSAWRVPGRPPRLRSLRLHAPSCAPGCCSCHSCEPVPASTAAAASLTKRCSCARRCQACMHPGAVLLKMLAAVAACLCSR